VRRYVENTGARILDYLRSQTVAHPWEVARAVNIPQEQAKAELARLRQTGEVERIMGNGAWRIARGVPQAIVVRAEAQAAQSLRDFAEVTAERLIDAAPDDPELDPWLVQAAFALEQLVKRIDARNPKEGA
jgi:predicted ArsR family transcriptional regulator